MDFVDYWYSHLITDLFLFSDIDVCHLWVILDPRHYPWIPFSISIGRSDSNVFCLQIHLGYFKQLLSFVIVVDVGCFYFCHCLDYETCCIPGAGKRYLTWIGLFETARFPLSSVYLSSQSNPLSGSTLCPLLCVRWCGFQRLVANRGLNHELVRREPLIPVLGSRTEVPFFSRTYLFAFPLSRPWKFWLHFTW